MSQPLRVLVALLALVALAGAAWTVFANIQAGGSWKGYVVAVVIFYVAIDFGIAGLTGHWPTLSFLGWLMRYPRPFMRASLVVSGVLVSCGHGSAGSVPTGQPVPVVFAGLDCSVGPMRVTPHGHPRRDSALARLGKGRITIIVRDTRTHQPIPHAQASLGTTADRDAPFVASALADSAGHALIEAVPGAYYLRVQSIGYASGASEITLAGGIELSVVANIEVQAICN